MLEDDKVRVGVAAMQGWRSAMEDTYRVALELPVENIPGLEAESDEVALFGVFDGHFGVSYAQRVSERIVDWTTRTAEFRSGNFVEGLRKSFIEGDRELRSQCGSTLPVKGGTTALAVLMVKEHLYCACAGDSRVALSRGGIAMDLSRDHRVSRDDESMRIRAAGGKIQNGRLFGDLAVSRGFGNFEYKKDISVQQQMDHHLTLEGQTLTCIPEISSCTISPYDEFLVIASNGVWDAVSSQEAIDIVRSGIDDHNDPLMAAELLVNKCLALDCNQPGNDNITAIVIQLKSGYIKKSCGTISTVVSCEALAEEIDLGISWSGLTACKTSTASRSTSPALSTGSQHCELHH
jgi:protein phosphatase 2C family protein 2/3